MLIIGGLLLTCCAYFLGSIPFGLVWTRLFTTIDIRKAGSGNIGATNVRRLAGNLLGALTLGGDILKGALPVLLALAVFRGEASGLADTLTACVATGAFAGHLFPVYLGGQGGGKGVATALGCFLVISPAATALAGLLFVAVVRITRKVSTGSLTASVLLAPAVWLMTDSGIYAFCALGMAVMIFVRHRGNIARLRAGTEPTLGAQDPPAA